MHNRDIDLDAIEAEKNPFRLRPLGPAPSLLRTSIQAHGTLSPLWVIENGTDGRFMLLHGFRRWMALRELGAKRAPVMAFGSGDDIAGAFRRVLSDNHATRGLSLLEKAQALRILESHGGGLQDLPPMGLPARPDIERYLKNAQSLPMELLGYLSSKDCPLRRLPPFFDLDDESRTQMGRWAGWLKPALNDLCALAEWWSEAARIHGKTPWKFLSELAKTTPIPLHPQGSTEDVNTIMTRILEAFRSSRYPGLTAAREDVDAALRALTPPPGVTLQWDPTFEKRGIVLQARVRDEGELNAFQKWLEGSSRTNLLRRLIDRLK
jgi:hypothetical protein